MSQWLPDELRIEEGISPDTVKILQEKGQQVKQKAAMGASQSVMVKDGMMFGGADPRRSTALAAGL